jgi:hypothetical protein
MCFLFRAHDFFFFLTNKLGGTYEERVAWLNENVAEKSPHVAVVGIEKCTDRDQLQVRQTCYPQHE